MTADLLNLRRARKERTREAKAERAAGNRAAFGVPKAVREASRAREAQSAGRLEGHRRDGRAPDEVSTDDDG